MCAIAALLNTSTVFAQDPGPLISERPFFSVSPLTMPRGYWQLEAGYRFVDAGEDGQRDHALPASMLRFGAFEHLEFQLKWPGYVRSESDFGTVTGLADPELGLKWQITDTDVPFRFGLYVGTTLPAGDDELTSDEHDPRAALYWEHPGSAIFGTVTYSESGDDKEFAHGIGIAFSFPGVSGGAVELESHFPEGAGPAHIVNGSLSWLRGNDFQFDFNVGLGINDRAPDLVFETGVSLRW